MNPFRLYAPEECGADGYPLLWHRGIVLGADGPYVLLPEVRDHPGQHSIGVKDLVRQEAGHRCVRCLHPYRCGEHGSGEWSACDAQCRHQGVFRAWSEYGDPIPLEHEMSTALELLRCGEASRVEAAWRILTVHHLDGVKANLRWWNLAALCQRCHLQIQSRVLMERVYPWEHTPWFRPYVAGYYAWMYLGEELSREQVEERMDELLELERVA